MTTPSVPDAELTIPELMLLARGTYKRAVDQRLADTGLEDLPTRGGFILAHLADEQQPNLDRLQALGISKNELTRLVDAMMLRGFITRSIDPHDGTVSLALTERGHAAEQLSDEGAQAVDAELARRLTEAELAGLRRGLAVLGEIKRSLPGPAIHRGLAPN